MKLEVCRSLSGHGAFPDRAGTEAVEDGPICMGARTLRDDELALGASWRGPTGGNGQRQDSRVAQPVSV